MFTDPEENSVKNGSATNKSLTNGQLSNGYPKTKRPLNGKA